MKNAITFAALFLLASSCFAADPSFKAGAASVAITPTEPMWMAGYASRDKPAEGTAQELYAKALAIEDAAGTRLVIVTTDLIGIPRILRDALVQRAGDAYGLPPHGLLLNASHTHCGPELREKASLYGLEGDRLAQTRKYAQLLEDKLFTLIGDALGKLEPANLSYTHARAGFAMNRRQPTDTEPINSPYPDGPVDHDIPVLKVESPDGAVRAILFGYACHNTTLGFYQWCGDYAGYAQEIIQQRHPEAIALFLMGCGGDQNPYPRSTLEYAQQHGLALANGVEAALQAKPRSLEGLLRVAIDDAILKFAAAPPREELEALAKSSDVYARQRAGALLEELDANGAINLEYPCPVQAVQIGEDFTLVALGGETVVDFSLKLKEEIASPIVWIAGYSNDVFGYLPSERVLKEGGYEGAGAMRYSFLPGQFAPGVEELVLSKARELITRVRE